MGETEKENSAGNQEASPDEKVILLLSKMNSLTHRLQNTPRENRLDIMCF